jgi:hypothetical protein
MNLLDWIAAGESVTFVSDRDEEAVRAQIRRHHPRGFITDFFDVHIVAKEQGSKIVISRRSSFWGRVGVRCVAYILPAVGGSRLQVRIWHGPLLTAWFCFSYGVAVLVLLASLIAAFQRSNAGEVAATFLAGAAMAGFWIVLTGVFNALLRVQQRSSINELMDVVASVAKRPNKAPEPTSGTVTPRAEPRVAPDPPVAHL